MSPRVRTLWAANVLIWSVSYLVMGARMAGSPEALDLELWARRVGVSLVAILISALIAKVIWAIRDWPMPRQLLLAFAMSFVAGLTYGAVNYTAFNLIVPKWGASPPINIIMMGTFALWIYVAWCAVCFAINYDSVLKERTLKLAALQNLALDSENRMLRAQINPHFLFNTLNALSALIIDKRNDQAERVVLLLSRVLRRSLDRAQPDFLPLREELKAQREYLRIEQVRFGRRLKVVERVPDGLKSALAPSLILQPLVENAVKYGLGPSERPVTIEIAASEQGGRLTLSVTDDGGGAFQKQPPKLGLGLQNVQRRLEVLFGDQASLHCAPVTPRGFRAAIELPLRHG